MSEAELRVLELALRGLTPSAQPLDRDRLMFRAGRASRPRRSLLWPLATAASTLFAVGVGIAFWTQAPRVQTMPQFVKARELPEAPAPAPPVEPPTPERTPSASVPSAWEPPATRYEQLRNDVLRWGLDGLPPAPKTRRGSVSASDLLHPF
jgi:hypothetical protein